jgi:hypothetical protein
VFGAPVEKALMARGGHAKLKAPEVFWKANALRARFCADDAHHQNTTRLMTTSQHLSILIGTKLPAAEYETVLADT